MNNERERLLGNDPGRDGWQHWGPYLSERQWGTVREDYSADGTAWEYFPHDHARSRAYRWGEDGIAGLSDAEQLVCLSLALWNGRDSILKERLFGLTNAQGNHGEDVKEQYFYLDATPSHSYLKMLYKYPHRAFPYADLVTENACAARRVRNTSCSIPGSSPENRYFDVFVEYAQAEPGDILMQITAWNRGPDAAPLHLIPQLVLRNTWTWHPGIPKPVLRAIGDGAIGIEPAELGVSRLYCNGPAELLFTENESNAPRLWNLGGAGYFKDGFHERIVERAARVRESAPGSAPRRACGTNPWCPPAAKCSVACVCRAAPSPPPFDDFDQYDGAAARRGRRVLRDLQRDIALRGRARDSASGIRRHDLEQAILPSRYSPLAQGRSRPAAAARGAPARPQHRVAQSQQCRHSLHAGQMGVPVVCLVGSGVSLHPPRADRCRHSRSINWCC